MTRSTTPTTRITGRHTRAATTWACMGLVTVAVGLTAAPSAVAAWSSAATLGTAASTPQPAPQAAGNVAGNAVVVWADGGIVRSVARSSAGGWSTSVALSAAGETASSPVVAVRNDGSAIAVWAATRASDTVIESASRSATGAWTTPTVLSTAGATATWPQVAVDAAGNATAVWATGTMSVVSSTQTPGQSWTTPQVLSAAATGTVYNLHLAVNPSGAAVVGWSTGAATRPHSGNVVTRPAGGQFGVPVTLVTSGGRPIQDALGSFTVAIDPTGRATAAWDTTYAYASSQLSTGAWGTPVQLTPGAYASYVSLAVNSAGTAVAVWNGTDGLASASRPTGGVWSLAVTIDPTADIYPGAGPAANGTSTFMAWDNLTPAPRPVNGSTWTSAGGWTGPTTLDRLSSAYGYTATSVARLGQGALATWANTGASQATIRVSIAG
jgi:hypothetical protein